MKAWEEIDPEMREVWLDHADSALRILALRPGGDGWRCFFCNELFVEENKAREHFGTRSYDPPLCLADKQELLTIRKQRDVLEASAKLRPTPQASRSVTDEMVETAIERFETRAAGIVENLTPQFELATHEQKHLDNGSVERTYWHYGYRVALLDVVKNLRALLSKPQSPDSGTGDQK